MLLCEISSNHKVIINNGSSSLIPIKIIAANPKKTNINALQPAYNEVKTRKNVSSEHGRVTVIMIHRHNHALPLYK